MDVHILQRQHSIDSSIFPNIATPTHKNLENNNNEIPHIG